ncbi:MAG: hypothetical protein HC834_03235 [Rhodospirillales bacterium]|nr:hypothetical protein [Rhodospirillales bacterium]
MTITPIYAGLLTILFIVLSVRVIRRRQAARVTLGDGGDETLLRRSRAQANFAEYVPLGLLLMALVELQDKPAWCVHLIGVLLLVGRVVHAYGFSRTPEPLRLRVAGMAMTFSALGVGAVACLIPAF